MDIKSKNYKNKYYDSRIITLTVIFLIAVTALAISLMGVYVMTDAQSFLGNKDVQVLWASKEYVSLSLVIRNAITAISIMAVISMIVTLVSLVVALVVAGKKDENGEIQLNWFDKIFGEIQILALAGVVAVSILVTGNNCYRYFYFKPNIFIQLEQGLHDYIYEYTMGYASVINLWIAILMMLLGGFLSFMLILSLVKKIKAKSFTEYTIIGSFIRDIERSLRYRATAYWKLLSALVIIAVLSYISFETLLIVVVCIFIILPKKMDKYYKIKEGVKQLKNGNFAYKAEIKGRGELDTLAADLNEISDTLSEVMENEIKNQKTKTKLISNVSHDIKTPLTSMITYIDLLKFEGLDSANAEEYLNIIDEKTKRLKKLTEDLFDAAKASSGDYPVEFSKIDLYAILNQSIGEMDSYFTPKELEIVLNNHTENSVVCADGRLLHRILENLFVNTSKYSMDGSRVYIDMYDYSENYIKMVIKNISQNKLNITAEELMERFMRGDEARTTEGSGLGLSIARDLATLIEGEFRIEIDGDYFKANLLLMKSCEEKEELAHN
ncbi:MAG TPA: HAMP domain-containing sensor histidine kinase [Anaerovoracaceae bacterium]|nr:HAMP domain-containing sensor histidine kinase [Anaerovoracaceae bacterium]